DLHRSLEPPDQPRRGGRAVLAALGGVVPRAPLPRHPPRRLGRRPRGPHPVRRGRRRPPQGTPRRIARGAAGRTLPPPAARRRAGPRDPAERRPGGRPMNFRPTYRASFYLMLFFATLVLSVDATDQNRLAMLYPVAVAMAGAAAFFTVDRHPHLGLSS